MLRYVFFFTLFCFYGPVVGQALTLNGYVRDARTGEVLIGAALTVPARRVGTTTNTYGFYSLTPARATGEPFRLRSSRPIRPTSRTSATATGPKPLTKLSPRKRSQHPARK